jgi:2,4-dienoyl-CoA reductase-like NADH-dependent reductase (Old Yellow Enzyme family)/thioredoxin reductase
MTKLKHLFSPISIGTMELRNRIVMPAMGTGLARRDGGPSDAMIGYYAARAQGGAGLIITEISTVHASSKVPGVLAIDDDSLIPGWKELAGAVHAHGAKIWPQLAHQGRQLPPAAKRIQPIAASPIPCPMMKRMPKEMSKEDIDAIVDSFGEAAQRAKEAGLDGVELHGAHGYLICGFISPLSNKRTDEYGGSMMNRLRFPLEILGRIRARCGNDFPVGIRLSCNEMLSGGLTPEEVEIMCPVLAEAGFDAISITRANYGSFRWIIPPAGIPPAVLAPYAERVKKVVGIPVMVAHRIQDPFVAEHIIAQRQADLVCMGRALIADPDLPNKAAAGHFEDIIPCIACNQGCLARMFVDHRHLSCTLNRTVGEEKEMALVPTQTPKKVLVVGAGPGGLEAARVAALRGHHVTLCEKSDKVGGQFNLAFIPPTKQEFGKAIQYLYTQVKKAGVTVELGKEVTPELIDKVNPDVVIVSTGATPIIPSSIPGTDKPSVVTANDVLCGKAMIGDKVVIVGAGEVGCETADYAGERGAKQITILEMLEDVAPDMVPWSKEFLLERLKGHGVSILMSAKVKEILDDGVVFTRNGNDESIRGVDTVVLALGARPVDDLSGRLKDKVAEVYVIGDAKEPRRAIEAIHEAFEVARQI